jgi:hypothetical protein
MMEPFAIGFSLGAVYVIAIFVLIHKLGWAEQLEHEREERDNA